MINKFKIGQKVYCSISRYRNLEVISIEENIINCKGESYHKGERGYTDGWHSFEGREFYFFELRHEEHLIIDNLHIKNKWKNIISRNSNMCMDVCSLLEKIIEKKIDIDPIYQRNFVWTLKQKQKYIENLFKEKAIISPTFLLLNCENDKLKYELLDGKQRILTIMDFIFNKFSLSNGKFFKDLSKTDSNFILYHKVLYTRIEKDGFGNLSLNEKIELFLEINELGTKMSDSHIEKIKSMMEENISD